MLKRSIKFLFFINLLVGINLTKCLASEGYRPSTDPEIRKYLSKEHLYKNRLNSLSSYSKRMVKGDIKYFQKEIKKQISINSKQELSELLDFKKYHSRFYRNYNLRKNKKYE